MAYNNLILRLFTSLILIFPIIIIINYFDEYLYILIAIFYLLVFLEILFNFNKNFIILIISILYISFSFIFFEIYLLFFFNKPNFIFFLFIVIIFDTSSFICGYFFGNKKIIPNISPNKTFFGFYGGATITLLFSLYISYIFEILDLIHSAIFSILVISLSFFGDALESFFKRKSNIKDSSNILPGHGGFFDRFDSFIMSSIVLFYFYLI